MRKYTVIVTRDITESTYITVEAVSRDAAEDVALKKLDEQADTKWEFDDGSCNINNPYVTDVLET